MASRAKKKRVLLFVVCYNAEAFIESVLDRIPADIWHTQAFDTEVLIIDDESADQTFYRALDFTRQHKDLKITVLHNPRNQGYGGNQKIGYHYAVQNGFDVVVLLHGDGQYPPEQIGQMVQPILDGDAEAVFGSRMINKADALKGKMPLYKWIGNQILTAFQNRILQAQLSEFHTGYRAYKVSSLAELPFAYNSDYYDFDTDIIIQFLQTGKRIVEIPIPTFYGKEISRVNGFVYGAMILGSSLRSRVVQMGIFYHPKYDYISRDVSPYSRKLGYPSSHEFAFQRIKPGTTVLDIGQGSSFMADGLKEQQVMVITIEQGVSSEFKRHVAQDIEAITENYNFKAHSEPVNTILLLDIIEHLKSPEKLLCALRESLSRDNPTVIITTANVAFAPIRFGLLIGNFNYNKRGILDFDHSRLFTFRSLRQMLGYIGYEIIEEKGIPAPYPLAVGDGKLARVLLAINSFLIHISKSLFSYQIGMVARPKPTLGHLLKDAQESGREKTEQL
ncbi:MAG: glycosyltransferase [Anaerolineae bacterium]|nr:glycosyltransferase [Anaerolineae bacterium]